MIRGGEFFLILAVAACGPGKQPPVADQPRPGSLIGNKQPVARTPGAIGFGFDNDPTAVNVWSFTPDLTAFERDQVDFDVAVARHRPIDPLHRVDQHAHGYTWFGEIGDVGSAVFVVSDKNTVSGSINTGKQLFQVIPIRNRHFLVERRLTGLPLEHPRDFARRPVGRIPPLPPTPTHKAMKYSRTMIGVAFAYTRAVASKVGDIDTLLEFAIGQANLTNLLSNVPIWFTVEGSYQDPYTEHPDFATNVDRFATPGDDYLDNIHTVREHNGDLAVLLIDGSGLPYQYRGLSASIMASADEAFAVVDFRYITYYTVVHELGHLMGLRHDFGSDAEVTPFADGHGFRAATWRTMMATACPDDGCPRVARWSNGANGWGDEHSDSARVLGVTKDVVTGYRQ